MVAGLTPVVVEFPAPAPLLNMTLLAYASRALIVVNGRVRITMTPRPTV
jgi:hypothetical protein